ncbi:maltose acetyltransferase domain-containing protein [Gracilibacillus timonensis]|nr:maltose acetyltransferase domain-containing protein [Gracilibacillus timonensis]
MNKEEVKQMVNSGEMYDDTHPDLDALRKEAIATCRRYNKKVNKR